MGEGNSDKGPKKDDGNVTRVNTRQWAIDNDHDPKIIFQKLFYDDIRYLLTMDKLWAKRTPPTPLEWDSFEGTENSSSASTGGIRDQDTWTMKQCRDTFGKSVSVLKEKLKVCYLCVISFYTLLTKDEIISHRVDIFILFLL